MKAKVYVTLKPSVLDPQGKAIKHSVELLGYGGVDDIRQGKYFEIALDGSLGEDAARSEATRMAREILSNPIIEDFRVEIET
jgi:phosphoribosylformylglycinamidine synthase